MGNCCWGENKKPKKKTYNVTTKRQEPRVIFEKVERDPKKTKVVSSKNQCPVCKWLIKRVVYVDSRTSKKVVNLTCTNKSCVNYKL